jgi:nucleotide-binding universal stress UspA family protein
LACLDGGVDRTRDRGERRQHDGDGDANLSQPTPTSDKEIAMSGPTLAEQWVQLLRQAGVERVHGEVVDELSVVGERGVDLLVCGSRGYGPIQRALMGSVAEELMEGALHPVLVFPRQTWAATTAADPEPAAMEA